MIAESWYAPQEAKQSIELQWSRDHVIAERRLGDDVLFRVVLLQWSRDHVIAESCQPCQSGVSSQGFNGAAIM